MTDITPIVEAVIALLAAIITIVIVPLIRSKLGETQYNRLLAWVKAGVAAAEQLCKEPGSGAKKKAYVLGYLQERGVTYNASAIDTMIEAAVKDMNIKQGAA